MALIQQIGVTTKLALELQSGVYRQGWMTMVTEANQANFLKVAFQQIHDPEEVEVAYQRWLKSFQGDMKVIYKVMGDKLTAVLENLPTDAEPAGVLEEFGNQLMLLITNDDSHRNPTFDEILQIGAEAKQMLTDTAQEHVVNLMKLLEGTDLLDGEVSNE
jgi:hypothetical protein